MKIMMVYVVIVFTALSTLTESASGGEFGCKCILCLASPGGPMQYKECRSTIKKLYQHLYLRKPFPSCDMEESEGISIVQGVELWEACKEGYHEATKEEEYGDGGTRRVRVCRKQIEWEEVPVYEEYSDGYIRQVGTEMVPVYDEYTQRRRSEPYFVEVQIDGQQQGERFYYKIKKKKKGWF